MGENLFTTLSQISQYQYVFYIYRWFCTYMLNMFPTVFSEIIITNAICLEIDNLMYLCLHLHQLNRINHALKH